MMRKVMIMFFLTLFSFTTTAKAESDMTINEFANNIASVPGKIFTWLSNEVEKIGFKCELKEGYLKNKKLISTPLNRNLGEVIRSRSNKITLKNKKGWGFVDANSSLIVDCLKDNK